MKTTRKEILKLVAELSELYPDWRFGQMVANVALWAKGAHLSAIWDVEDEQFLKTLRNHLKKRREGHAKQ